MALKDISLGQYFPGNSLVHRLDPRTKLIAVVIYIVALFLAKWFVTYAIMFCLLALSSALASFGKCFRIFFRNVKSVCLDISALYISLPRSTRLCASSMRKI